MHSLYKGHLPITDTSALSRGVHNSEVSLYLALRPESGTYLGYIATACTSLIPKVWWIWLSVRYVRLFAIAEAQMGPKLVSIVQNNGVSAVEGF